LSGPSRWWIIDELFSLFSRIIPAAYFTIACIGFWNHFVRTGKWTSLLWMISEGVVIILLVFRRTTPRVSRRPWDWIAGLGGSFFILAVRPEGSLAVAPVALCAALQVGGTAFQVYAKIVLGRSFGIIAADRGIVVSGPYRVVRHPIYTGYLVTHIGFILANWSAWNLVVYAVAYFFQVARIFSEESLLRENETYREYSRRVRYRLIPGLF
jgi:protein-S-isoprenylcysteine O-methyltransferase Ste14